MKELLQPSCITDWFSREHTEPTPAQEAAWPKIERGANVLIVSPPGSGKTVAALVSVLNQLALWQSEAGLQNIVYALYVSPRADLSCEVEMYVRDVLRESFGEESPIRAASRTVDTPEIDRQSQLGVPPHVLLTTPESLAALLSESEWSSRLEQVRWVIVDDIQWLAESKRGAHLGLSMERLEHLVQVAAARRQVDTTQFFKLRVGLVQRLGLAAPVAPVQELAQLLVGTDRACDILDFGSTESCDISVYSPLAEAPYPQAGFAAPRLIAELARLVKESRRTVLYANDRNGAEAIAQSLRAALPELAENIECCDDRAKTENDQKGGAKGTGSVSVLRGGDPRAVVCSHLEDRIGSADLVVMLSPPKSVSRAVQCMGRTGVGAHSRPREVLIAGNMDELVECCLTAPLAGAHELDALRLAQAPLDVLAQHLAGMGCTQRWTRESALKVALGAFSYRDLTVQQFNDVLDYLAGGARTLRQQYADLFGKIHLDDNGFETRKGRVPPELIEKLGTPSNDGMIIARLKGRALGAVEESFLRQLEPGDVFMVSGKPVRLERISGAECFVAQADGETPTMAGWSAKKLPLASKIAEEIIGFRSEMRDRLAGPHTPDELTEWINQRLSCGAEHARLVRRMHSVQQQVSEIPTRDFVLIEEFVETRAGANRAAKAKGGSRAKKQPSETKVRHYFFHALVGQAANEALVRVVKLRFSRLGGGNVVVTANDYGFVMTTERSQGLSAAEIPTLLAPANFEEDLRESLSDSNLLKYYFRSAAEMGLLLYERYGGEQRTARKLQFSGELIFNLLQQHEPDHVLLREAWRELSHAYCDIDEALRFASEAIGKPVRLRTVTRVPPLAFGLFARTSKEALSADVPAETMERLFHEWWHKDGDAVWSTCRDKGS